MTLSRALILLALIATIFSTMSMAVAKDFIVGDDSGWTTGFDYHAWAANKVFRVGDTLTFKYPAGKDNVIRVNGSDFINCSVPPNAPVLSNGYNTFVLANTGRRWYISGVANHCKSGQKLVITVLPPQGITWSPAPSPSPVPSEVPSPHAAPWPASIPHFGLSLPKKIKMFQ
ncbi:Phytocyanin domain [Sesbania bispinosa]|nr:Phytocyanin domain [Sesbania bispinosa]KAJ1409093.1 Phytocyanin domain [Sesbania bispinosa]